MPNLMFLKRHFLKYVFCPLLLLAGSLCAGAETPQPHLAILSDQTFGPAGDLLSVELSHQTNIVLLERSEIDRILKEQNLALSETSLKDNIKVGQILGADGLLTLGLVQSGTNSHLAATLIAVKQGVILDVMESPWPIKEIGEWPRLVRAHFQEYLPKLGVLPKDALPISVLNLRSAANSQETKKLERELTELLLNRLTHERELFVLERRKLDKLTTEKEFNKTEESPFWNGSYLLEGIIDKNGYSKEEATISARLVPPGGETPVEIEIFGKRNQPEQMIEQLARRIMASLKKKSSAPEWKPAAEAMQYYEEAKWALKWNVNQEAQAAAESAWALGKRDMDCALVRINSYLAEIVPDPGYQRGTLSGFKDEQRIIWTLEQIKTNDNAAGLFWEHPVDNGDIIRYLTIANSPQEGQLDASIHILSLYYEFAQTTSPQEPRMDSAWYRLGVNSLIRASQVLQHYYLMRESQKGVKNKLAELRRLARAVSEYILKSPSVRDAYWVGERVATHDELARFSAGQNIFQCKLLWGSVWQEAPEDSIALYRDLMRSDVFCYIHKDFWFRGIEFPRLAAWRPEDKQKVPLVWNQFVQGMEASTNLMLRLEAKSLELARTADPQESEVAFTNLFKLLFDNREAIVTNNVEVLYQNWGLGDLVGTWHLGLKPGLAKLGKLYNSEYAPKLAAMDQEYWTRSSERKIQRENQVLFEQQKEILKGTSYEFFTFEHAFQFFQYTPAQALELKPLLANYKTNLSTQTSNLPERQKAQLSSAIFRVEIIEKRVNEILRTSQNPTARKEPVNQTNAFRLNSKEAHGPDSSAKPLLVEKYFEIPERDFPAEKIAHLRTLSHVVREGKLFVDLRYDERQPNAGPLFRAAVGIWNPQNEGWRIIPYPANGNAGINQLSVPIGFMGQEELTSQFEFFNGALYISDWEGIKRYDSRTMEWEDLHLPEARLCQLFAMGGRLYASSDDSIFEILDQGHSTRLLASIRRRPEITLLDSLESLDKPVLFPGPGKTVRTSVNGSIYSWDGQAWNRSLSLKLNKGPEDFADGTLLRFVPLSGAAQIWFLPHAETNAVFCWQERVGNPYLRPATTGEPQTNVASAPKPFWKPKPGVQIAQGACVAINTNLYFFQEDCGVTNLSGHMTAVERNGHHGFLFCLNPEVQDPLSIPLKFDTEHGAVPSSTLFRRAPRMGLTFPWMATIAGKLVIGHGSLPGIWVIPQTQIDAAIARDMQDNQSRRREAEKKPEDLRKELMARYDHNHDGTLDAEESEAAVLDPAWLELNWPLIDTNGNGLLDAEDNLNLFDANGNDQAEEAELSAIDKIQSVVAAKLLERWDQNRDGVLDEQELRALESEDRRTRPKAQFHVSVSFCLGFDADRDRSLDQKELQEMLAVYTHNSILTARPSWPDMRPRVPLFAFQWNDPGTRQLYQKVVEHLWRQQRTAGVEKIK
ncbi:CsgG/HfaB family protein [Pedosphaera parvula]|uniref:Uncharacterized protein n=1 Tax=Pedosphaera parvula (strain Ellin514) TaxID=320771 RepID=B9XQI5_PEDPL|nr:CsgG/HfaB family protein [Pedosphaera parvula]EEF57910.1 hypothetical protein Cflav_PD0860 [Pedosphaera parvula Ellin514]